MIGADLPYGIPFMSGVAVASSSQLAADIGAEIARAGGNAVDAAVAAMIMSMTSEPGVCSLGASGFVTIGPANGPAVTIEGYAAMPGLGVPRALLGTNAFGIEMGYGGGMHTIVGYGSIAVPGAIAALGQASARLRPAALAGAGDAGGRGSSARLCAAQQLPALPAVRGGTDLRLGERLGQEFSATRRAS